MFVSTKNEKMKKLKLLTIVICLFAVSCIPSLHPIYTENDIVLNDRIIGEWMDENSDREEIQMFKDSIFDQFANNMGSMIKDHIPEADTSKMNITFSQFETSAKWTFERAVNATATAKSGWFKSNPVSFENSTKSIVENNTKKLNGTIDYEELDHYILSYYEMTESDFTKKMMNVYLTKINGETYADFFPHEDTESKNMRFASNNIFAHTFAKVNFSDDGIILQSFDSEFIEDLIKQKRVRLKHEVIDDFLILTASTEELRAFVSKYGNDENLFADEEYLVSI